MSAPGSLHAVDMDIDSHDEPVVYMRRDCDICRAEGFSANTRLEIRAAERSVIATLNVVGESVLPAESIGFSHSAWRYLALSPGQRVSVRHAPVVGSLSSLRKKIHGHFLDADEIGSIIGDIARRYYSDIEIAAFLTACAGGRLSVEETVELTRAMVNTGNRLRWPNYPQVFDKHCVGGLPGNRTTPIVIAIASAAGLVMPKTSSRAITSPAGTADTMEVLTSVALSPERLQAVVRETGACLAWGGHVGLSPTDDLMIRIERALDLDGEGQLVASVLSKKLAVGSTHVLIDIPVGPTAKVRDAAQAQSLSRVFEAVAAVLGLQLRCVVTDGTHSIGHGIGPAEEARDVLGVLQNHVDAPVDLAERSLLLAAHLLSMHMNQPVSDTLAEARDILRSGRAWSQFQRICDAQGGLRAIPEAACHSDLAAEGAGILHSIDNRRLALLAKLAGAPSSPEAGLRLRIRPGEKVALGQPLATLFAATRGELAYAAAFYEENPDIFRIGEAP